jgi:hypothetical protein
VSGRHFIHADLYTHSMPGQRGNNELLFSDPYGIGLNSRNFNTPGEEAPSDLKICGRNWNAYFHNISDAK